MSHTVHNTVDTFYPFTLTQMLYLGSASGIAMSHTVYDTVDSFYTCTLTQMSCLASVSGTAMSHTVFINLMLVDENVCKLYCVHEAYVF